MRNLPILAALFSVPALLLVGACVEPEDEPVSMQAPDSVPAPLAREARPGPAVVVRPASPPVVIVQAPPRRTVVVEAPPRPTVVVQPPARPNVVVRAPQPPTITVTPPSPGGVHVE